MMIKILSKDKKNIPVGLEARYTTKFRYSRFVLQVFYGFILCKTGGIFTVAGLNAFSEGLLQLVNLNWKPSSNCPGRLYESVTHRGYKKMGCELILFM